MCRVVSMLLTVSFALALSACTGTTPSDVHAPPRAGAAPAWAALHPGPHAVGFTSHWLLDDTRTYATAYADGGGYGAWRTLEEFADDSPAAAARSDDGDGWAARPRPVLVNAWYPALPEADAAPMVHGGYLDIAPRGALAEAPGLAGLTDALVAFARGVIAEQLLGAPVAELDADGAASLAEALATPVAAVRDAPRAPGRFPLVLLHGGAFSSFEDNAVLAEWLASQGFVVVGSPFQDADFNVDGLDDSYADLRLLAEHTRRTLPVTDGPVGLVGHSFGAHATLRFVAQSDCPVGAAVSLDTTQDQASLLDTRWRWAGVLAARPEAITTPILFTANPHAFFELGDALVHAERAYLTFRDLDHDGFTSQGVWRARLDARRGNPPPRSSSGGGPVPEPYAPAVERSFAALCEGIGAFLSAQLLGDRDGWDARIASWSATPLGGDAPHLEFVPVGVSGPSPYEPGAPSPPTPRQVRPFLAAHGASALAHELGRFADADPPPPVQWRMFAFHLLWELAARERDADALALWPAYAGIASDVTSSLVAQEKLFRRFGYTGYADVCLRALRLLAPDEAPAQGMEDEAP